MSVLSDPQWNKLNRLVKIFKVFISTSWISLFMVLFITLMLTMMAQGPTIVVDLLSDWKNLLLFYFIGSGFVLILSHFPVYFYFWRRENNLFEDESQGKMLKWKMYHKVMGLGLVTYKKEDEMVTLAAGKEKVKIIDRIIGAIGNKNPDSIIGNCVRQLWTVLSVFTVFASIYVLLFCYRTYIDPDFLLWTWMCVGLLLFGIIWIFLVNLSDQGKIYAFYTVVSLGLLLIIVNLLFVAERGWSPEVFSIQIVLFFLGGMAVYLFRTVRPFRNKELSRGFLINVFNSPKNYLILFWCIGLVSWLVFILAQNNPTWFSPVNIILSFLILIYGFIVLPIKHRFYYLSHKKKDLKGIEKFWGFFFPYLTPFIPFIILGLIIGRGITGNDLHTLPLISESKIELLQEDNFITQLRQQQNLADTDTLYFIGTYGGGLKANIWTMMVLDELSKRSGKNILDQTVAISGVSGGSMGLAFYSSICNTISDPQARTAMIKKIATDNYLSRDLAWLFGKDFINEMKFSVDSEILDRAKQSMIDYEKDLKDPGIGDLSFRKYWTELFNKQSYWPILITNASQSNYRKGVSCSLVLDDFPAAFPGAIDLLSFTEEASLSFAHAVSCSNRFPLISPAAKVKHKGVFVDGGYFENSGIMSVLDLYEYFKKYDFIRDAPIKFIEIMPHEGNYVEHTFDDWWKKYNHHYNEDGEWLTVVKTGIELTFVPRYFDAKLEALANRDNNQISYQRIMLPYKVEYKTVKKHFGLEHFSGPALDELSSLIKRDTQRINGFLLDEKAGRTLWEVTEPSTARILGERTWEYMQLMIKEGNVFD